MFSISVVMFLFWLFISFFVGLVAGIFNEGRIADKKMACERQKFITRMTRLNGKYQAVRMIALGSRRPSAPPVGKRAPQRDTPSETGT